MEVVAAEHIRCAKSGRYIEQAFWDQVRTDFDLRVDEFDELPDVFATDSDDDRVGDQIGPMMVQAVGRNPATQLAGVCLVEQRLASGRRIAAWQIKTLLEESRESDTVVTTEQWTGPQFTNIFYK